ncbi:hypothetical protein Pelo_18301 [Pelomyxa schiedti]|nr:hypothetical protein Pelo_18301 [Pelomyxa schiedti]
MVSLCRGYCCSCPGGISMDLTHCLATSIPQYKNEVMNLFTAALSKVRYIKSGSWLCLARGMGKNCPQILDAHEAYFAQPEREPNKILLSIHAHSTQFTWKVSCLGIFMVLVLVLQKLGVCINGPNKTRTPTSSAIKSSIILVYKSDRVSEASKKKEVTKATVQTAEDSLKHKVEVMAAEEMAQVISSKYFHDATLTEMDNIGSSVFHGTIRLVEMATAVFTAATLHLVSQSLPAVHSRQTLVLQSLCAKLEEVDSTQMIQTIPEFVTVVALPYSALQQGHSTTDDGKIAQMKQSVTRNMLQCTLRLSIRTTGGKAIHLPCNYCHKAATFFRID